ncbi:Triosephosphate isomerase [hydrothermal vent metagenome]|uniref:Triosephosphate isomerase n=1 Tax=hydrothermal vent metagenome TaxID=652676 RepID=A0A3B0TKD6_9ZZZZ
MAPVAMKEAKATFGAIKKTASVLHNVQTVICPPFIYINELKKMTSGHRCVVGAQDSFWSEEPANTGEVSPGMLNNLGVQYVILGHSERRALGETDELVSRKVSACLKSSLSVVLCVGESERDEHGEYTKFIKNELAESLAGVKKKDLKNIIVAYEPIWAIGKNAKRVASPEDALEIFILVKKILVDLFGKEMAMKVPILYGGSVNPKNTRSFLEKGEVDGLLIGRASLDAKKFSEILKIADSVK